MINWAEIFLGFVVGLWLMVSFALLCLDLKRKPNTLKKYRKPHREPSGKVQIKSLMKKSPPPDL